MGISFISKTQNIIAGMRKLLDKFWEKEDNFVNFIISGGET